MALIACYHCDLGHSLRPLRVMLRSKEKSIDRTLAWTITAITFFAMAITFPFLGMTSGGFERQTALLTGVQELYFQGMPGLSVLVMLTCVLIPLVQMLGLLYVFSRGVVSQI